MTEAKITKVPLHRWVVRAVFSVTADEAEAIARGSHASRPIADTFVRYEGPTCLACGAAYEPGGPDECSAENRIVTTVQF